MSKISRRLRGLIPRPQDNASAETQQSSSTFQHSSSDDEDQDQNDELDTNAIWVRCLDGSRRKLRERANATDVYNLPMGDKIVVEIDDRNCPCTKAGYLLGTFLSAIVKDGKWTPIHIPRWDNEAFVKKKQNLLEYIELKFSYDEKARSWVLAKLNEAWRNHKTNLKAKYFDGKSFNMAESNPPDDPNVLPEQWGPLVILWNNPDKKKECEKNASNASKQVHHHTGGRMSIARKRKEMMAENYGKEPDRITLWDETHKRKEGSYIKEQTKNKMVEAHTLLSTRSSNSEEVSKELVDEVFLEVMGPEHDGRVKGVGPGVTQREYYGVQFH